MKELQHELETIAEEAGGKKRIKGEAYQPDYDVLVKEVLAHHPYLLFYGDLPKTLKRVK
jgi:hypothetical protein